MCVELIYRLDRVDHVLMHLLPLDKFSSCYPGLRSTTLFSFADYLYSVVNDLPVPVV